MAPAQQMEEGTPLVAAVERSSTPAAPSRRVRIAALAALAALAIAAVAFGVASSTASAAAPELDAPGGRPDGNYSFVPDSSVPKNTNTPPNSDGSHTSGKGGKARSAEADSGKDDDDSLRSKPKKSKTNYNKQKAKAGKHITGSTDDDTALAAAGVAGGNSQ